MVIIPKRNWRVCLHCGHIFKREDMEKSVNMSAGAFEVCPKCSCPAKKEYSGDLLTKVTAAYYFMLVERVKNGVYQNKAILIKEYQSRGIPEKLWYFGDL